MATSDEGGRGGGTRRACDHRSAHVVSGATMVPLHCRTRLNRAYGQPAVGVGTPIVFALPRYREGIRPHLRRGVVVGAETARVGGLQRLAIVSRRKVVDGVLAQPCVQARGKTPHGGVDRGSSSLTRARGSLPALGRTFSSRGTHSNVSRKPPSICASRRATARACGEGLGDPPETNSPNRLPPTANGGTAPPVMNTRPRVTMVYPARREPAAMTKASTPHSSLRVELSSRTSPPGGCAVMNSIPRRALSTSSSRDMP